MTNTDALWDNYNNIYQKWGIASNPFNESIVDVDRIRQVFTGQDTECSLVLSQLRSANRSRILVYGDVGIGKTSFIKMMLDLFQRRDSKTLTGYISLPNETDLATAATIALARKMPNDEWAQAAIHQMNLIPSQDSRKKSSTLRPEGIGPEAKYEDASLNKSQVASLVFEDLLDRALAIYARVIIAIDDLDKQDPATIQELLLNAQGVLKGKASFILTGHPSGITQEILLNNHGLFERTQQLTLIDFETIKLMLLNYLNSVRSYPREIADKDAFAPFTAKAADLICHCASGSPRILNRIGSYTLADGAEQNLSIIDVGAIEQTIDKARRALRDQI
jgi:GTPase SAR1 family protein